MKSSEKLNADGWIKNYRAYLYYYAAQRVGDPETANDLVQETFLSALERSDTFEGKCTELTWLRRILSNKIIDHYRRRTTGLNSLLELHDSGLQSDEYAADDPDRILQREFYALLDKCLSRLPPIWMTVFKMKHLDQEKPEVICRRLQLSSANYWVIVHRAKLRMREYLNSYWTGNPIRKP